MTKWHYQRTLELRRGVLTIKKTSRKTRKIFELLLPLKTMEPGDLLCLVLFMVLKKRDCLGQYDKIKYSFLQ